MSIDWTAAAATVGAALRARGVESDLVDADLKAYANAAVEEIAKRIGPVTDIELHADGWGQRYISLSPPAATGVPVTLATSLAADDIIDTAADHGFVAGQAVHFTTLTGGAGLTAGTIYWVTSTSLAARTFRVAATAGGVDLGFTTDITAGVAVGSDRVSEVTEEGIALDADDDGYRIRPGGAFLERLGSGYPSTWRGRIHVTYDAAASSDSYDRVVVDLVKLALQFSGLASRRDGDYAEEAIGARGGDQKSYQEERDVLISELVPAGVGFA